jgi:hypothetical protein
MRIEPLVLRARDDDGVGREVLELAVEVRQVVADRVTLGARDLQPVAAPAREDVVVEVGPLIDDQDARARLARLLRRGEREAEVVRAEDQEADAGLREEVRDVVDALLARVDPRNRVRAAAEVVLAREPDRDQGRGVGLPSARRAVDVRLDVRGFVLSFAEEGHVIAPSVQSQG